LGGSDGNKHVLLLTENGGKIVKTPDYRSKENNSSSTFTVSIDLVGGAVVKGKMRYRGVAYERPDYILNSTKEKREEYINDLFSSPNITINNLTYSKDVSNYPVLTLECNISVRDFVSRTKKRMVFNPYLFAPHPYMPKTLKEDFIVNSTKVITDTVEYSYPFGYSPEYIPEAIQVETRFGKYQCQVQVNGDKLFFTRKFEYYQGDYAREEVAAFAEFVNKIADSGRQRIILKKKLIRVWLQSFSKDRAIFNVHSKGFFGFFGEPPFDFLSGKVLLGFLFEFRQHFQGFFLLIHLNVYPS
jgi:hypothetical protein